MSTFSLKAFKPCDKHFWELKRLEGLPEPTRQYVAERVQPNGGCPECRDWTNRHANILAEQDAQRFVARWEKRQIKLGTAWRDRNTGELHFYMPLHPGPSVPQSRFMPKRPDHCLCHERAIRACDVHRTLQLVA